jgi:hypothetical protein
MVVRRILGSKGEDATAEWRKLHIENLRNLYLSDRVIDSRRMRWALHTARMGEMRIVCTILVGKLERKRHLKDLGVDNRSALK